VGPKLTVTVTHAGATLPIAEAPNLSAGDQLWIKADLPPGQSVHYLLVTAFLRGATNPPQRFARSGSTKAHLAVVGAKPGHQT
jgi:hypothetical protein